MKVRPAIALLWLSSLLAACATMTSSGGAGSPSTGPGSAGAASTTSNSADGKTSSAGARGASGAASGSPSQRSDGSADAGVTPKTAEEQRADIDGKLDASLGRFDEQMRREQQRTASERDAHAAARADGSAVDAAGNGMGTGSGTSKSDDVQRDRAGDLHTDGQQRDGSGSTGDVENDGPGAGGSIKRGGGGGAAGKPIPSGAEDDIVARRLRRAAEAETDPELKEKLWNEYRDYIENTKGTR